MYQMIYTLPLSYTVVILLLATLIWQAAKHKLQKTSFFRGMCLVIFIIWMFVVLDITLFSRSVGKHEVYLMPFSQLKRYLSGENRELLRSFWMNVLMFAPCGFLLRELLPKSIPPAARFLLILGFAAGLSVIIEVEQWYRFLGEAETDDVIANATGAILGYCLTRIAEFIPSLASVFRAH